MADDVTVPLPVAIVGLSTRGKGRLHSFLNEIADDLCKVVEVADAQAFIADIDRGDVSWTEFRARYHGFPTIVLSTQRPDLDDVIWVPKPIMEVALVEALRWAINHVQSTAGSYRHPEGSRHGADMVFNSAENGLATGRRDSDATLNIYYFNEQKTLISLFQKALVLAREATRATRVSFSDGGELLILPRDELVGVAVQATQLMELSRRGVVSGATVQGLSINEEREAIGKLETYQDIEPVSALLWKLAVWTARGQLPLGTDPHARYYLRCWPNFTRLLVIPHAIRIASLWIREPMSLIFLSEELDIAPADVFTFYFAAKSLGIAGHAMREDDYLLANRETHFDSESGVFRAVTHIARNMG